MFIGQNAAQTRYLSDAIRATAAATAAATAMQGTDGLAQSHRSTAGGVRPQSKATRMSYHLPPQYESAETGDSVDATGRAQDPWAQTEDNGQSVVLGGIERGMQRQSSSHGAEEIPTWRRVADEVETAIELCVGDVVRARWVVKWNSWAKAHLLGYARLFRVMIIPGAKISSSVDADV